MAPMRERTRKIVAVAFPDFQMLDVTGPLEVFSQATRLLEARGARGGYALGVHAARGGSLRSSSGLALAARPLAEAPARPDTLLITGGRGVREAVQDRALVAWIRRRAAAASRVASVCTGAFLLGAAGLLRGRRVTTHWEATELLARACPDATVEPDRIWVKDGRVYTSAGVTAGIDLALALVAEDHGRALALEVARQLVVFLKRPGGQSQFSSALAVQVADREPIAELLAFVEEHLAADLTVPVLARRAAMSPRNFARRFSEQLGTTPARFVLGVRLAAARRRLEESTQGLERIAEQTGLGSADSLRRAFVGALGITPSEYRARFSARGATS